jgi:NADH-quinone oxidoreductase subunit C
VVKDVEKFLDVMTFLKNDDEMQFDFLRSVSGVDWPEDGYIDSVYHLYSYELGHAHVVKYRCPRAMPEVPSVEALWPTANWFERETYDLFGVQYLHHSDLRRIMLPDDWIGHPLLKDYVEEQEYRGIGTTRASPLDAFAQMDEARRKAREERGEDAPRPITSSVTPPEGWVDPKEKRKQEAAAKAAAEAAQAPVAAADPDPDGTAPTQKPAPAAFTTPVAEPPGSEGGDGEGESS